MRFWTVPASWPDETVYIVAGGESASAQNLELLRDKRVILINSSYERLACFNSDLPGPRIPAADFLIFGDNRWWASKRPNHKQNILKLPLQLVTVARMVSHPRVLQMRKNAPPGLQANRHSLTMRRTTLTAAINLAALLVAPESTQCLLS